MNRDPAWLPWSASQLAQFRDEGLAINQLIYAEVGINFRDDDEAKTALDGRFEFLDLPWEAALPAGRAYLTYRQGGGTRTSPLPDFYIGAHAQVSGLKLLTRDGRRYRSYFPDIELIAPD